MLDLICDRPAGRGTRPPSSFPMNSTRAYARILLAVCAGWLATPAAFAAEPPLAAPFDHYQHWRDEPLLDWREVNARVGQIGGWRTYLRESQEGSGAAATSKPTEKPTEKSIDKPSDKPGAQPSGNHSQHGQ